MAPEKSKLAVEQAQAENVKVAAASPFPPKEDILKKEAYDAIMTANPSTWKSADPTVEIVKGSARPPSGWRRAPGQFQFLTMATQRLWRLAPAGTGDVQKVQAYLIEGTKILIIKVAPNNDLSAYKVHRTAGRPGCTINLFPLLGPVGLITPAGWKDRFDIAYIPKGSPAWPGLMIDLGDAKERRRDNKKKDEDEAAQGTKK